MTDTEPTHRDRVLAALERFSAKATTEEWCPRCACKAHGTTKQQMSKCRALEAALKQQQAQVPATRREADQ